MSKAVKRYKPEIKMRKPNYHTFGSVDKLGLLGGVHHGSMYNFL